MFLEQLNEHIHAIVKCLNGCQKTQNNIKKYVIQSIFCRNEQSNLLDYISNRDSFIYLKKTNYLNY